MTFSSNGRPQKTGLLRRDPRDAWAAKLCKALGLPPPDLDHAGLDACWGEYEVGLLVVTDDPEADRRRRNAAALDGWRVLSVTPQEWQSGVAFRLVRQAALC